MATSAKVTAAILKKMQDIQDLFHSTGGFDSLLGSSDKFKIVGLDLSNVTEDSDGLPVRQKGFSMRVVGEFIVDKTMVNAGNNVHGAYQSHEPRRRRHSPRGRVENERGLDEYEYLVSLACSPWIHDSIYFYYPITRFASCCD